LACMCGLAHAGVGVAPSNTSAAPPSTSMLRGTTSLPLERRLSVAQGQRCDTFAPEPNGGCSWGNICTLGAPAQPDTIGTCMPSGGQSPLSHYEPNAMYNCYANHGGEELGYVGVTSSPADCAVACDRDDACRGFVYMYSQNKCWTRGEIELEQCEVGEWGQESSTFSTFTKKSTPPATTAPPAVPDGYEAHPLRNCYAGHGGVEIGSVAEMQSLESCAKICDQAWGCNAFVFMSSQRKCWKRAAVNLEKCEIGVPGQESSEFTTYTKK